MVNHGYPWLTMHIPQDYKNIMDSMADPASKKRKTLVKKEPTPEELQKKAADEQSRKVAAAFQAPQKTTIAQQ